MSTPPKAPFKVVVAMCAIMGGLQLDEQLANNVLPLTIRHLTASASVIGLILSIHPAFGFLVQPIVGILGDRIWTPVGRRAFFLVTCGPLAALSLLAIPEVSSFWLLLALIVLFQLFFAVLWGSDHPLVADLLPPGQRTAVMGAMMTAGQLCSYLFVRFGMGYAMERFGDASVYRLAAAGQIVLVAFAALFLNERRVAPAVRPKLTAGRYVRDMLGDPILRRFALLGFTYAAFVSTVSGFAVLFAVRTLFVTKGQFGSAWSSQSLVALLCAIPIGLLVARLPKQWALVGALAIAMAGCVIGLCAGTAHSLYAIAIIFGFGMLTADVIIKPFYSEYLPRDIIGQLVGAYNICYASGRIVALIGTGWIVAVAGDNYRAIWIVALIYGALAALTAATIPDLRHAGRKEERAATAAAMDAAAQPTE